MPNQNNQEIEPKQTDPKQMTDQGQGHLDDLENTDDADLAGATYSKNLMGNRAESQVRENEDASLQDDTYAFDSDNTGNEDIHDVSDFDSDSYESYGEDDLQ